jgi:hypothetical protein
MIFFAMSREIGVLAFRIGCRSSLAAYTRLKWERSLVPCRSRSCHLGNNMTHRLSLECTRWTMLPSNLNSTKCPWMWKARSGGDEMQRDMVPNALARGSQY